MLVQLINEPLDAVLKLLDTEQFSTRLWTSKESVQRLHWTGEQAKGVVQRSVERCSLHQDEETEFSFSGCTADGDTGCLTEVGRFPVFLDPENGTVCR